MINRSCMSDCFTADAVGRLGHEVSGRMSQAACWASPADALHMIQQRLPQLAEQFVTALSGQHGLQFHASSSSEHFFRETMHSRQSTRVPPTWLTQGRIQVKCFGLSHRTRISCGT